MAAKITPVVPTPRRYESSRTPPLILSGVSQETDVTDVAHPAFHVFPHKATGEGPFGYFEPQMRPCAEKRMTGGEV
jgi:hypothetical protein